MEHECCKPDTMMSCKERNNMKRASAPWAACLTHAPVLQQLALCNNTHRERRYRLSAHARRLLPLPHKTIVHS
jgi:hypothetical protein